VKRICRTIQISDTGIIPGSGIGNPRGELSVKTLGVPVIAVGVPTVVDVSSILSEFCEEANVECDESIIREQEGSMIVTPKDIDSAISDISRLIGYGLNMALHKNLSISDIDMFVG
jgi:spore protease